MASSTSDAEREAVTYLRSLPAIRERCRQVFDIIAEGNSKNFKVEPEMMQAMVDLVLEVMRENFPQGASQVPFHSRWRHFEPGNVDRVGKMKKSWAPCSADEESRRLIDLAMVSVLLDAGAGDAWKYKEPETETFYARSEGLGVASFHMFCSGAFSSNPENKHQVDADTLCNLASDSIEKGFQVDPANNPLTGCEGRTQLLKRLGLSLKSKAEYFQAPDGSIRPGNLVLYLFGRSNARGEIDVQDLFHIVIDGLQDMWPAGRTFLGQSNMGDVWPHSGLKGEGMGANLVPFHKLSQWLTYSLMEPIQATGLKFINMKLMTGLAEYRNGGLLVDTGYLVPLDPSILKEPQSPDSEVVVEWRAATVVTLDEIAAQVRQKLNVSAEEFPLVKVLECGTWKAGRVIAKRLRPETGGPPIAIKSDGTVF